MGRIHWENMISLHCKKAALSGKVQKARVKTLMPRLCIWPQVNILICQCCGVKCIQEVHLNKIKGGKKVNYLKIRKVCYEYAA